MPASENRWATASYSSGVMPGAPLMMKSRCRDAHSCQRSNATSRLSPSAPAIASGCAPARIALCIAIGCQRFSHVASADIVASSASSSYAVRSSIGQAVRSTHN
jgi:hypothetical protein